MSTILKALKKVEGNRAAAAKTEIPRALRAPVAKASRKVPQKYTVMALLLLLAAIGIAGYRFWPFPKKPVIAQKGADTAEVSKSLTKPPPTVVPPLSQENVQITEINEAVTESTTPSSGESEFRWDTPQKIKPELMVKRRSSRKPPSEPERQRQIQIQKRPAAVVNADPPTQTASDVVTGSTQRDIPILQDRSMVIQALVYSDDSAKRMIVLNGEILRQGANYNGYIIETIESQRVLVRKKGEISALRFGK